jgi:uncharacterized membrane protein
MSHTSASPPATVTPRPAPAGRIRLTLGWLAVGLAAVTAIVFPLAGFVGGSQVVAQSAVALALIQGTRRYGWRLLIAFFVICYVISSFWENLSIMTGFPFGNYTYTLMPQLFYVPVVIGVTYFGIGWVSWMVTNTILDRPDERLDLRTRAGRINVVALPVLAGAVMTMWDVGADSLISTVRGAWIWEDGGGVFGVPFTNYLGWWFVTWSFFQVFTLVLAARQTRRARTPEPVFTPLPRVSQLQPTLIYSMFAISAVTTFAAGRGPETATDPTGIVWDANAINETLMVVNIFTIIPVAIFALVKIARGDTART